MYVLLICDACVLNLYTTLKFYFWWRFAGIIVFDSTSEHWTVKHQILNSVLGHQYESSYDQGHISPILAVEGMWQTRGHGRLHSTSCRPDTDSRQPAASHRLGIRVWTAVEMRRFLCWTFTRVSFVIRHNLFLLKYIKIHTSSYKG